MAKNQCMYEVIIVSDTVKDILYMHIVEPVGVLINKFSFYNSRQSLLLYLF